MGVRAVDFEPGESTTAEVTIPNDALAVTDSRGRTQVESGAFELVCEDRSTEFAVR